MNLLQYFIYIYKAIISMMGDSPNPSYYSCLDPQTINDINEAVQKIDIETVISEAEKMGITVSERKYGCHTIIENGKPVPLDLDKHFRLP